MEANMVQTMAPTWLQNGSKMAPWRPLGGPWARPCCQTLPGGVPERLWHGPGRPQEFILPALERSWDEQWIDCGLLEGPREGPGGGLGGHLGSFLAFGPAGTKKKSRKVTKKFVFWICFCMRFLTAPVCVLFASALAGAKAQLKNMLKTIWFSRYNLRVRRLRAEREHPSNRKNIEQNTVQMQAKNTMPRKLEQKSKKHCFGSQNVSKNRPRRPPGAPWPPPARDFRAKSSPKALLEASRGGKKFQGRPWEKFPTRLAKKWTRSAALAEAVKAYPGGFRPGKTRLNDFKHAHHRKRWSAD